MIHDNSCRRTIVHQSASIPRSRTKTYLTPFRHRRDSWRVSREDTSRRRLRVQGRRDAVKKPGIGIRLARIPHHDAAEAVERGRIVDDGLEVGHRLVPAPGGFRARRDADVDPHIGVLGRPMRPGVPALEVEVILLGRALGEAVQTAVVVVELHPDRVEEDCFVEHGAHGRVREHALRGRGEVVFLQGVGRVVLAQLVRERRHVPNRRFEVEVEAVDDGVAEWTQNFGAVGCRDRPEGVPEQLGAGDGCGLALETPAVVGGAAEGQEDRLSEALAGFDVLP